MKGICGKPRRKEKTDKGSVHLTKELFTFDKCEDGVTRLFIGSKKNNIGYLNFKSHRQFNNPKSIYIKKMAGGYYISFCYEDNLPLFMTDKEYLSSLKNASPEWLEENTIGIDRGIAIPAQTGDTGYDFSHEQKLKMSRHQIKLKRYQRRLSRQQKGSNRRKATKYHIAKSHKKIANIRYDFCHKTSHNIVESKAKVIIFEDLKTSKMTRRAQPKQNAIGRYLPNKAAQKSGLNRSILSIGWHYLETYCHYKANRKGKAVFKVPAPFTSQECAECGHIHPDNRKQQAHFACVYCGHVDNADRNASLVIKKRAIKLLKNSGTELVGKGIPVLTIGRGASDKSGKTKSLSAIGKEPSKKTGTAATLVAA